MVTPATELAIPDLSWLDDPTITTEQRREPSGAVAAVSWIARSTARPNS